MTAVQQDTLYGPWDYSTRTDQFPYDDTPTYGIMAEWVAGHGLVEDWGAGVGWAKRYITNEYRAIDGAWSQWADVQADLREYVSDVPCVIMRHVLEHNWEWRKIARNFSLSWHDRAALVLFIPPQVEDVDVGGGWDGGEWPVPDLAVSGPDLMAVLGLGGTSFTFQQIEYPTKEPQWGWEGILLMER